MQITIANNEIVGWDIGGANLKAAWLNTNGNIKAVYQEPCSLWQGLDRLESAMRTIEKKIPMQVAQHVFTMTGELVDLFSDRAQGVKEIITVTEKVLGRHKVLVYAGRSGFIPIMDITTEQVDDIASANWLASASYVARQVQQGLLVDIGSTTTDLILLQNNRPDVLGYTDYKRLVSGELVYTGLLRTAVMAIAQSVPFAGSEVGVMSEYFATMADVYRLTEELNERYDQSETADGKEKSTRASERRLARMVGCDARDFKSQQWQQLAYAFREKQLSRLQLACTRQLERAGSTQEVRLVGAGIGRFLVQDLAGRLDIAYQDFDAFFISPSGDSEMQIADCAPAVAIAYLVLEDACKTKFC